MDIHSKTRPSTCNRLSAWVFLILLCCPTLTPSVSAAPPALQAARQATCIAAPLLAEGWSWRKLYHPIESALSNRRRMVQLAVIGMCIGIYILMRK
jgi:hypothetical protein